MGQYLDGMVLIDQSHPINAHLSFNSSAEEHFGSIKRGRKYKNMSLRFDTFMGKEMKIQASKIERIVEEDVGWKRYIYQ